MHSLHKLAGTQCTVSAFILKSLFPKKTHVIPMSHSKSNVIKKELALNDIRMGRVGLHGEGKCHLIVIAVMFRKLTELQDNNINVSIMHLNILLF